MDMALESWAEQDFCLASHPLNSARRITVESFLSVGVNVHGKPNFPGSWRRNFVGSVIRIILINIKQMIVHVYNKFVWMEIHGQGLPTMPRTLVPHEQRWFHSTFRN